MGPEGSMERPYLADDAKFLDVRIFHGSRSYHLVMPTHVEQIDEPSQV